MYQGKWSPNYKAGESVIHVLAGYLAVATVAVCQAGAALATLRFVIHPNDPIYLYSWLPQSAKNRMTTIIYTCLWFHVAQVMYGCVCFVMIMGLAYALSIFPFLAIELRPNKRNEYKLSNRIRTFAVLPSINRSLEVLQLNVNCVIGMIFIPAQTIITQLVLICICMSVRKWGEIGAITKAILIGWASGALLFWFTALEIVGRLELGSRMVLRSWRHWNWSASNKKHMNKFQKSCVDQFVYELEVTT